MFWSLSITAFEFVRHPVECLRTNGPSEISGGRHFTTRCVLILTIRINRGTVNTAAL